MNVRERIMLLRLKEKLDRNTQFAELIGVGVTVSNHEAQELQVKEK